MSYLEELLPKFRKGAKIRCSDWIDGGYIQKDEDGIVNQNNYNTVIPSEDALSNKWELYKDPELDWQYIIKNKCLCWFWDDGCKPIVSFLSKYVKQGRSFLSAMDISYTNCRPVRRDEVAFYEDRKDD